MDVIRAGTRLLDTEGVEKLSMRKLANTLGTGSSTLYW
ncbi:TetR family transcriptional regulator, partial [Streptosporangium sp. NPDC001682]